MKHFTPRFLLPIAILFLFTPHSLSYYEDTQSLIFKICTHTYNFGLCSNIFNRYLRSPTTDIIGLAEIAIIQTLKNASNTRTHILEAIRTEKRKKVRNGYRICESLYRSFVDEYKDADLDFKRGDYTSMLIHVGKCFGFVNGSSSVLRSLGRPAAQLLAQNAKNRVLVQMSLFCGYYITN
ncbi:hypothetical protein PHJA_002852100 [Phtheirospermum japonicum]|uniref:Pectinesterase inhibitor domain-containing protein n=1 Tax=Phtheirospermum japonicum TaxID=374723 RepID=A0A830D737_9LAMI|nr:hypothetical protein PHJA_002852100 [Phtheirospermum japonicum]